MDGTLHPISFYENITEGGLIEDPRSTLWVDVLDHELLNPTC